VNTILRGLGDLCGGLNRSALLLALTLLSACTATRPQGPPLPDLSAADLQALIESRRGALRSLRSEATISVTSPRGSVSAQQLLAVERPDRLRAEIFSPFGTVLALVVGDGELAAYVREENRVYRGQASPRNLERWSGLSLSPADVVDLLLGTPPQRDVLSAAASSEPATGRLRLRQQLDEGAQVVYFAGETPLPVEIHEVDDEGVVTFRVSLADFRDVGGIALATHLILESPAVEQTAEIALKDPEVNPELPAQIFELSTPPGSREVEL
jgi:outer membrane lipoprotein-sorting protein